MDVTEKAIHNLALAFCEVKTPNYLLFKSGLESLVRMTISQYQADIERDFQQANAALKDKK